MRHLTAVFLMLTALFAMPVAAQSDDRGVLQRFLEENLSATGRTVRIDGFTGALSGRATLERLTIADDAGIWLTVEGAVFDWNRGQLLRGALDINQLSARSITLHRTPKAEPSSPSPEASPIAVPDLPVSIDLKRLAVERLSLGADVLGDAAELSLEGSASLDGGEGQTRLDIARIDGAEGTVLLQGSFSNTTSVLALQLDLSEGPGGIVAHLLDLPEKPSINLTISGEDPVSDFSAQIALATNGQPRLSGIVEIEEDAASALTAFRADIGGDLRPLVVQRHHAFLGNEARLQIAGQSHADGRLQLDRLQLGTEALSLEGSLALGRDGWPERIALDGRIIDRGADVLLPLTGPQTRLRAAVFELNYDAARGDAWQLNTSISELKRNGLSLAAASLAGAGQLAGGLKSLSGELTLDIEGLDQGEPALNAAVGDNLDGRLRFDWTKGTPLRLLDLRLNGVDYALNGSAEIEGVEGKIDLAVDLDVRLDAQDLSRFAELAGQNIGGRADLQIKGRTAPISGGFDLAVQGGTEGLSLGLAEIDAIVSGETRLDLSAKRDETGVLLRRLDLRSDAASIEASGTVATGASNLTVLAELGNLADLAKGVTGPVRFEGSAIQSVETWRLSGDLSAPGGVSGQIESSVVLAEGQAGTMDATGDLRVADASAYAPLLDLPIGGGMRLQAKGSGDLNNASFTAKADIVANDLRMGQTQADAVLRGRTDLSLDVSRNADGVLILNSLKVENPAVRAALEGSREPGQTTLRYDLALKDAAIVVPDLSGPLTATGTLAGTPEPGITRWTLVSDLGAPGGTRGRVNATGEEAEGSIGAVQADFRLTTDQLQPYQRLAGLPLSGGLTIEVVGSGNATDQNFGGRVEAQAASLGIGQVEADRLLRGTTRIAGDFRMDGQRLRLADVILRGNELQADLSGVLSAAETRLNYQLGLRDLGVLVSGLNGAVRAEGGLSANEGPFTIDTVLSGPGGTRANVSGQIARDGRTANLASSGSLPLGLANRFIAPNLLEGQATFDLRINGGFSLDALSGEIRSSGGRMILPAARISLTDIATNVLVARARANIEAKAALSTGGRLSVTGQTALQPPFRANLNTLLSGLTVTDPGLFETRLDGEIALRGPLQAGAAIVGQVNVGVTEVRIPDGLSSAGGALPGLQHRGEPAQVRQTRARAGLLNQTGTDDGRGVAFPLDLTINAPARIFVRGRGLDAEFGGALDLRGTTANVIAEGRFDLVRGRLDILGKRLTLTEAFLQLQGDFDPYIRAVATTTADGTGISIIVEGPASSPEVSFSSSPELPDEEILARLLFGRDMTEISPLQALQLANAIRVLAGKSSEGVVGKLRQSFGLDDLDIATSESGATGLTVGKYISDNVYTGVTVDTSGQTEINLNLQLSPSVTLRGSAGSDAQTGIGIFFERDY